MNKHFSNKITVLNYIMTIFMCLYHFQFQGFGYVPKFFLLKEYIGAFAMTSFFLISGFLMYQNANSQEDAKKKVKNRAYTLLVPYFIWNIVAAIRNIYISENKYRFSFSAIYYDFLIGPANGPLWYLIAIYLLCLIAPLVVKYKHKKKTYSAILLISFVLLYLRDVGLIPIIFYADDLWWYYNIIGYLPYYLIGAYIGLYHKDFISKDNYPLWLHIAACAAFVAGSLVYLFSPNKYISPITNFLMIISVWLMLPNKWFKTSFKPLTSSAFLIYVLHYPILTFFGFKLMRLIYKGTITTFGGMLLVLIIALIVMLVMAYTIITIMKLVLIKHDKVFLAFSGGRVKNDIAIYIKNKKEQNTLAKEEILPATKNTNEVNSNDHKE